MSKFKLGDEVVWDLWNRTVWGTVTNAPSNDKSARLIVICESGFRWFLASDMDGLKLK